MIYESLGQVNMFLKACMILNVNLVFAKVSTLTLHFGNKYILHKFKTTKITAKHLFIFGYFALCKHQHKFACKQQKKIICLTCFLAVKMKELCFQRKNRGV